MLYGLGGNCMKKNLNTLLQELVTICARLRGEEGCLWDRQQDHRSLIPYLKEESGEVIEAIENKDSENLCEELGDLLYQIIFHSQIAAEKNEFAIEDVIKGITRKIIRRHPHVFGDKKADSVEDIIKSWKDIKKKEKEQK